jgi:hypothetical protein
MTAEPDTLELIRADFDALSARVKRLESFTLEQRVGLEKEMRSGFQELRASIAGLAEAIKGRFDGLDGRFNGLETEMRFRFEQLDRIETELTELSRFLRSKLNGHQR